MLEIWIAFGLATVGLVIWCVMHTGQLVELRGRLSQLEANLREPPTAKDPEPDAWRNSVM